MAEIAVEQDTTIENSRGAFRPFRRALSWLWRSRGLWLALIGLACALYGQKLVTDGREQAVMHSIRWYTAGIVLVLLAWAGTYKNKSLLRLPGTATEADETLVSPDSSTHKAYAGWRSRVVGWLRESWRYMLAFAALGLNLFSVSQLREDYYSAVGGWGWVASLILLLVAFIGHRPDPGINADAGVQDVEDRTDWRIPRKLEIVIFLAIVGIALVLRLHRLGDLTTGMHGDEGLAGVEALRILDGNQASPFLPGWFGQSNFYYWCLALTMQLFGSDLFGLRMFSALVGVAMILPLYLLVRMWFGTRTAIVAATLLAISGVAIQASKIEFSNSTTPFFLVTGFFFLFRGLSTRRTLDFVLAGYAHMASLYFYNGGRLAPVVVLLVLLYLFGLMPLGRLLSRYRNMRQTTAPRGHPETGNGIRTGSLMRSVWLDAVRTELARISHYRGQLFALAAASLCIASPWLVYFLDHGDEVSGRARDTLIFNKPELMASDHRVGHDPLYVGLRMPTSADVYPVLPVVFEKTPVSMMVSADGFWPRVLWAQTTLTLSILTYRGDTSAVYSVAGGPIAQPMEAVLIIGGVAWALWRWRDTRMAVLSIWFWSTIFAGGVLTEAPPYMPRLVGIIPTLAIFAAITLSKLAAEYVDSIGAARFPGQVGEVAPTRKSIRLRWGQASSGAVLVGLLVYLGMQSYASYYSHHLASWPFIWAYRFPMAQVLFVRQMNEKVEAEGRAAPVYYILGLNVLNWNHGANQFVNYGVTGSNLDAPESQLPAIDTDDRDVVFIIAQSELRYLPVIEMYHPGGEQGHYVYGPPGTNDLLFTYYHVKGEQGTSR